ncbi:MAG: hypothetical protein WAM97_22890 [Acidimicrobiales bacterium]|jgi:hypothetical protein
MRKMFRRLTIVSVLILPVSAGLLAGSADAASSSVGVITTPPNVNLSGSGHSVSWSQSTLKLVQVKGTCSSSNYNFSVTNTTSHKQTIFANHANPFHIQPAAISYVCAPIGATVYTIASSKGQRLKVETIPASTPVSSAS